MNLSPEQIAKRKREGYAACKCGAQNVWSEKYAMWFCSKTLAKYATVYGTKAEI